MVDVVNPQDEGPFAGDRAGGVPATALVDLCFAPGEDARSVKRRLFGDGGLYALLGTRDAREALRRAEAGDLRAALVVDAMCYQVAKAAGGLAAALEGKVDAILLTGGMAHLDPVVEGVRRRVAWIAPVHVLPGEDELRALAEERWVYQRLDARTRRPAGDKADRRYLMTYLLSKRGDDWVVEKVEFAEPSEQTSPAAPACMAMRARSYASLAFSARAPPATSSGTGQPWMTV